MESFRRTGVTPEKSYLRGVGFRSGLGVWRTLRYSGARTRSQSAHENFTTDRLAIAQLTQQADRPQTSRLNMGGCFSTSVAMLPCANGNLTVGARIQTQYTLSEGGDNLWYTGSITDLYSNGDAAVRYDDGDRWTGRAIYCYLLPSGSPGMRQPQPYGAPSQGLAVIPPGTTCGTSVARATPALVTAMPVVTGVVARTHASDAALPHVVGRPL